MTLHAPTTIVPAIASPIASGSKQMVVLGTGRRYREIVDILVARRRAFGWSQLEFDEVAGFQEGYTSKLECFSETARGKSARTIGNQ